MAYDKDEIEIVEMYRPIAPQKLEAEIRERQSARDERIQELEALVEQAAEASEKPKPSALKELEELRSLNGTHDAEEIMAGRMLKAGVISVDRGGALKRAELQRECRKWLAEEAGIELGEDLDSSNLDPEIGQQWLAMWQGLDIQVAMVPGTAEGWKPPKKLTEWVGVKEYIFLPLLQAAWALNPTFTLSHVSGEA